MAESCAWRMVSKLKVRPFHSVNSPLWEPVRTLLASGVHYGNQPRSVSLRVESPFRPQGITHCDQIDGVLDFVGGGVNELGAE